uniref:BTB domain-containing protein n=1 Tax=Globodera pallida TaxID=36090 RepID=A0A183BQK2_GLOPA
MLSLDGGPRRVNHAAVAIGDKIYSFGGYSANDPLDSQNDFIDIHMLNTFTYRWERLPVLPYSDSSKETKALTKHRSATISAPGSSDLAENGPSTSADSSFPLSDARRRRAKSLSDIHPLAQIRSANPPLEEGEGLMTNTVQQQRNTASRCNELLNGQSRSRSVRARELIDEHSEEEEDDSAQRTFREAQRRMFEQIDADMVELGSEIESSYGEDDSSEELDSEDSAEQHMETDGEAIDMGMAELAGPGYLDGEFDDEDDNNMEDLVLLTKFHQHPEIPFKRYGHTVVAYRGCVYLWGGRNDKLGCNQTLHRYNPLENRWAVVPTEGQCPPARDGHSAVVYGDFMYIFGGFEEREHRFSHETYAFHFSTRAWNKLKTEGEPPQYRDFHAASVLDGIMYVFGGRSDEMGQLHTSHDVYCEKLHCLDLKTHRWNRPEVKEPMSAPCGRRSLTMWTYRDTIYLFGGYQSIRNTHFNDLWRFDPKSGHWVQLLPSGQGPIFLCQFFKIIVKLKLRHLVVVSALYWSTTVCFCLAERCDLYVLDFAPSLASLCSQTVIKFGLHRNALNILPAIVMKELCYLSTPNQITKSHMPSSDSMTRG